MATPNYAYEKRQRELVLYVYGRNGDLWWGQQRSALGKLANLRVRQVGAEDSAALAGLAQRSMRLQCTVQDGHIWLGDGERAIEFAVTELKTPAAA